MPKFSIDDRAVHFWTGKIKQPEEGRGLLLLHGAGGNGLGWFMQKHALGSVRFCCAPDLPGHGRSLGKPPETIAGYVPYLLGLLDRLGIDKVDLIGHSMGGAIAQTLAARHPDRVASLVLIGTAMRLPVPDKLFAVLAGDEEEAARFLIGLVFTRHARQEFVRNVMDQMDFASAPADFAACDRFDGVDQAASISAPTCVIVGSEDRITPVALTRELAEAIPGAIHHIVDDAAHLPMLEKSEAVNSIITDFLKIG